MIKVLTVVGARPQFIKAATVCRSFLKRKDKVREILVHTGQHHDPNMSDLFFQELDIPKPATNLEISGGSHGQMTGRMLEALEKVILDEDPDFVLVYGDTNSTLAGALAAAKLHKKIVHVEAGLRSFNRNMPEEINRVLTDHLSALLFCPTAASVANLKKEGITAGVNVVGDVMYDAALYSMKKGVADNALVDKLGLKGKRFTLATIHRAENTETKEALLKAIGYLHSIAKSGPIVFPIHPRTRKAISDYGIKCENLILCDPVGSYDMGALLSGCELVVTDSGGLQKEAYFFKKPCITVRDETEWVETVEAGWNKLWTSKSYKTPRKEIADYGDGNAADKIVETILGD